jgi:hypothetical protein
MITFLGRHALVAATIAGGLTCAAQAPANASGFSATYTCDVPGLGPRTVGIDGWLTSPGRTVAATTAAFRLHIASMSLSAPIPVDSWSATAWINVSGAENASFQVSGAGGFVPVGQPITGDLTGDWTPSAGGTDLLSVGGVAVSATTRMTGNVTVQCTPNEPRPVAETLTVDPPVPYDPGYPGYPPPYYPGGWRPPIVVAPPYHPGGPHHPGWGHPGGGHPGGGHPGGGHPGGGHPGGPPHHGGGGHHH